MKIIFKEKYLYPNVFFYFFYNIQKTKIVANDPITKIMANFPLWQIDGETMETVTAYFLGLQNQMVTAAMKSKDAWSLEEKLRST